MRIFKTAWFARFARLEGVSDDLLREAVSRIERGLIDARLGGGVIKQRLARDGQGRSAGYRAMIAFRRGERAIIVSAYAKSSREGLRPNDIAQVKRIAKHLLTLTDEQLNALVLRGDLEEVTRDDLQVPE